MNLTINPTLELNAARAVFKKRGRVLLPQFLTAPQAQMLSESLSDSGHFHLTMNRADDSVTNIKPEEVVRAGEEFQRGLMSAVFSASSSGFRYFYGQFEFDKHLDEASPMGNLSRIVWHFFQSSAFLGAIGKIIGVPNLVRTSAQASRYAPGHFLTRHDDDVVNSGRRAAFVLYLTPQWQADWGGLLQFIDRDGHVAEAYTPTFNALALFKVPTAHAVSMVTPLAPYPRIAISGWVH